MPMLLQPAVRTRQPRGTVLLDPKWAPRIYACVDAGNLVSYLNGSVGVPYVSLTTPARASGYWARKTDARGDLASAVSYDQLSTHLPRRTTTVSELTLFAAGFIGAASGATFQVLSAMLDLNGPTYIAYIAFDRTSGKLISGLFKGGAWTVLDSGITFEYGRTYRCSLTAKSGYAEMYVDGVRVATDTSAGWVSYTTFRDLCVGNSEYDYYRLNGGALVAGATRTFSPSDARALSANPWQIFRADGVPSFTAAAGGGDQTITLADTGSGADALAALSASFALSDSGAGVDSIASIAAALALADTGAGVDGTPSITVTVSVTEAGAGAESFTGSASIALAESGAGVDALSILTETLLSITDAATGADAVSITVTLALAESGAGTDGFAGQTALALTDAASGVDLLSVVTETLKSIADSGAGADNVSITVHVPIADGGAGLELLNLTATLAVLDLGVGYDVVVITNPDGAQIVAITFAGASRRMGFDLKTRNITFTLN